MEMASRPTKGELKAALDTAEVAASTATKSLTSTLAELREQVGAASPPHRPARTVVPKTDVVDSPTWWTHYAHRPRYVRRRRYVPFVRVCV